MSKPATETLSVVAKRATTSMKKKGAARRKEKQETLPLS